MFNIDHEVAISTDDCLLVYQRDLFMSYHQIEGVDWNYVRVRWYIHHWNLFSTAWNIDLSAMFGVDVLQHYVQIVLNSN